MPVTDPERRRQIAAAYYARHKEEPAFRERVRQQTAKWRAANPEKARETAIRSELHRKPRDPDARRSINARYSERHRNEIIERGRQWRAANKAKTAAYHREYYLRNKAARLEYGRRWREENADRHREMIRDWESRNREHVRERGRNDMAARRAAANGVPASLTRSEWDAIKALYGYRCAYCRQSPDRLTQDHVIPISRGGGHTMENVVPACQGCNSRKGNRLIPAPPPSP